MGIEEEAMQFKADKAKQFMDVYHETEDDLMQFLEDNLYDDPAFDQAMIKLAELSFWVRYSVDAQGIK